MTVADDRRTAARSRPDDPCATRAVPQPRTVAARVQLPRAGAGARTRACRCSSGCATCASPAPTSTSSSRSASPPCSPRWSSARRCCPTGMAPARSLERMHDTRRQAGRGAVPAAGTTTLRPALNEAGIRVLTRDSWNAKQKRWLQEYFNDEVLPVLSPLGLDPAHPFPRILNKSLNVVVVLEGKDAFGRKGGMAIVRAPRSLPRIIQLPRGSLRRQARLRVPVGGADRLRRRPVPGHEGQGRLPVPRDPQLRAVRRRGGSREPRQRAARANCSAAASARRCGWRSPSNCPKPIVKHPAAELRPDRERGVPHQRPGQPQPRDPGVRPGRTART